MGVAASKGIGIASSFVIPLVIKIDVPYKKINKVDVSNSLKRLDDAVKLVARDLQAKIDSKKKSVEKDLLEAFLIMLEDEVFISEIKNFCQDNLYNIEYSLLEKLHEYVESMKKIGDDFLASRAQDVADVFGCVMNKLLDVNQFDISRVPEKCIVVASAISTFDMIELLEKNIVALALDSCSATGHVAILAKEHNIPLVFGIEKIESRIATGETLIVDGNEEAVYVSPNDLFLNEYKNKNLIQ